MKTKGILATLSLAWSLLGATALAQVPINDDFASGQVISGNQGQVTGNNVNATLEVGEPDTADGVDVDASIWFYWQAPATGTVTFDTFGSDFDTVLAAYTGGTVQTLTERAANDQGGGSDQSEITFTATAGTIYRIAVSGYQGDQGNVTLNYLQPNPAGTFVFSTSADIIGEADPNGKITVQIDRLGGTTGAVSVKYTTAPGTATDGQDYVGGSAVVDFADGESSHTVDITITNDADFEPAENFTVTLSNATGGANLGTPSVETVTITSDELPPNDNFANATVITGASGSIFGSDASATAESGPEQGVGAVVWYKWVAPNTGSAVFSVDSLSSHFAAIFRGPGLLALQYVSPGTVTKTAAATIVPGATYYIAVGGGGDDFTLNWQTTTNGVFELAGLRNGAYLASENGGGATITVRRTGSLTGTTTVTLDVAEDTAGEFIDTNATAGSDFTGTSLNVVFVSGESEKTVTVPILNDTDTEDTEDFVVSLSSPQGGGLLGNVTRAAVLIYDDEGDPANDDIANAAPIFGTAGAIDGLHTLADTEPLEPPLNPNGTGHTIWYRWTAPLSGLAQFTTTTGTEQGVIDVFAPTNTALNLVATGDASCLFNAVAGGIYLIRVDGDATIATSATTLSWGMAVGGIISFDTDVAVARETEGDVTLSVTISRLGGLEYGAAVVVASADGTAFADVTGNPPGDYVGTASTLVFSPGEASKTVNVTIHGDAIAQGARVFTLNLQSPSGAIVGTPSQVTVTIDDNEDDQPNDLFANAIVLTGSNGTTNGDNTGAAQETGEPNPFGQVTPTVWYSWTAPATGVATFQTTGFDTVLAAYTGTAVNALTLVAENDDDAGLGGGSSRVSFPAVSGVTYRIQVGGFSGAVGAFALTFDLDLNGSVITVDRKQISVAENLAGGKVVITFTRVGLTTGTATVDYAPFDDTAVAGLDYTLTPGTVTFNPGDVTKIIEIPITDDAFVEGDEDFSVTLTNPTGAVLADSEVFIDILDNDDDPLPAANDNFAGAITLTGASPVVAGYSDGATTEAGEPGSPGHSLWYQWTAPSTGVTTVGIDEPNHSFNIYTGTALNNLVAVAYQQGSTFATTAGTTYFVQVNWSGDVTPAFVLSLSSTTAGVFTIGNPGALVNENAGPIAITVSRGNGSTGLATVRLRTAGLTATAGADFTSVDQVVTFGPGVTSQTVNVPILNDALLEGDETVQLILSTATGGAIIGSGANDVVFFTINDDEDNPVTDAFSGAVALSGPFGSSTNSNLGASRETGEPVHVISGSQGNAGFAALGAGASIWFKWTAPATGIVTFTTANSATPSLPAVYTGTVVNALTPVAYTAANVTTLSFTATGGTTYAIAVDSIGAARGEVTLEWNLVLPGALGFAPVNYSVLESGGNAVLTVTRAIGADGAVTVHYTTVDGSATAGEDYTATSGDLNFASGETSKTITVPILNDTIFEVGETFTVALSNPTNGSSLGLATTATVSITSNDPFAAGFANFNALVNPNGAFATSGIVAVSESATGSFTAKLTLGGKTYSSKGAFDSFGSALLTIQRKGLSTLAIALQLDDAGQTLAGHVYDGAFDSTFTGQASFYDGKTRLYPQPGPFTLATLPTTNSSGIPQGIGFANVTVATNGTFTLKGGQLGDSATYTAKGFIAKSGEAQVYVLLYKNLGSLAGVVNFRSLATTDADGTLRWLRPANQTKPKLFVPGFDTTLTVNASFYTKPAANTRIDTAFDANNGAAKVELRNGNLQAPLDVLGTLDTKNKLTATAPIALTLNGVGGTGALNGSFTPVGGKKTAFKGVFLQKSDQAVGQFFGASASGSVTLKPN